MTAFTNPIQRQNLVNRFASYVRDDANAGIVWGTNALPFPEFPSTFFGGTTAGRALEITGNTIPSGVITANHIYNILRTETRQFTHIRRLRAILFVTGPGGNTGSRPTPGIVFNQVRIAHLGTVHRRPFSALDPLNRSNVWAGNVISSSGLNTMFSSLRSGYRRASRWLSTSPNVELQINVCHASCHSSCHSSRGRR